MVLVVVKSLTGETLLEEELTAINAQDTSWEEVLEGGMDGNGWEWKLDLLEGNGYKGWNENRSVRFSLFVNNYPCMG